MNRSFRWNRRRQTDSGLPLLSFSQSSVARRGQAPSCRFDLPHLVSPPAAIVCPESPRDCWVYFVCTLPLPLSHRATLEGLAPFLLYLFHFIPQPSSLRLSHSVGWRVDLLQMYSHVFVNSLGYLFALIIYRLQDKPTLLALHHLRFRIWPASQHSNCQIWIISLPLCLSLHFWLQPSGHISYVYREVLLLCVQQQARFMKEHLILDHFGLDPIYPTHLFVPVLLNHSVFGSFVTTLMSATSRESHQPVNSDGSLGGNGNRHSSFFLRTAAMHPLAIYSAWPFQEPLSVVVRVQIQLLCSCC